MAVQTSMAPSGLAEVLDRILDKGIVIDAWVRVSLLGLELLTVEARVVIAGVETYLKYVRGSRSYCSGSLRPERGGLPRCP